ncbi:MAG TPA: hypothetical protein VFF53_03505 [Geobacteraceae bacterium]|nr:hypothetical protein [Aquabacterium sp.]HZV81216.1 hypothetical protein [Geobacteraceae bacterium]
MIDVQPGTEWTDTHPRIPISLLQRGYQRASLRRRLRIVEVDGLWINYRSSWEIPHASGWLELASTLVHGTRAKFESGRYQPLENP